MKFFEEINKKIREKKRYELHSCKTKDIYHQLFFQKKFKCCIINSRWIYKFSKLMLVFETSYLWRKRQNRRPLIESTQQPEVTQVRYPPRHLPNRLAVVTRTPANRQLQRSNQRALVNRLEQQGRAPKRGPLARPQTTRGWRHGGVFKALELVSGVPRHVTRLGTTRRVGFDLLFNAATPAKGHAGSLDGDDEVFFVARQVSVDAGRGAIWDKPSVVFLVFRRRRGLDSRHFRTCSRVQDRESPRICS